MLSIMDPVTIENCDLYRDDEDPKKFYLLPDTPVIATDKTGNPDFFFIQYLKDTSDPNTKDDDLGGGFIQFRSIVINDPAKVQRIVNALRAQLQSEQQAGYQPFGNAITSTDPVLASPIWTSGTVKMETFAAGDNQLIRKDTDTVPCDLAGSLGASMDLTLDSVGTSIFWAAFQQYATTKIPIVIQYQLTYRARVSATMTIHAERTTVKERIVANAVPCQFVQGGNDPKTGKPTAGHWQPIQDPAWQQAVSPGPGGFKNWHPNWGFLQSLITGYGPRYGRCVPRITPTQVKETIQSMVTDSSIEVKIESNESFSSPGGTSSSSSSGDKTQDTLYKLATDILSDKILPMVFGDDAQNGEPTTDPNDPNADPSDPNNQTIPVALNSDDKTTESAVFDMHVTSTTSFDRQCNPSGPVQMMIKDQKMYQSCFQTLRLIDGFFSLKRVAMATAGINFERDGIDQVHVFTRYNQVDYGDPQHPNIVREFDDVLRATTDTLHWKFDMARDPSGNHIQEYQFRTDVYYQDMKISSDWQTASDNFLSVNPAAMGAVRVELAFTAPRDQVRKATVTLSFTKADGSVVSEQLDLSADDNRKTWFKATGAIHQTGEMQMYTYQVTYAVGNTTIAMPEVQSSADSLEIPGPFTKTLSWTLVPQGLTDQGTFIEGDATYSDPDHQYSVLKHFVFTKLSDSVSFDVPAMDGAPEAISVVGDTRKSDGSKQDLPPYTKSGQGTVAFGPAVFKMMPVTVLPDLLDFDKDIQLGIVTITYHDDANGYSDSKQFKFSKSSNQSQTWTIPIHTPTSPQTYDVDGHFVCYDRTKSFDIHLKAQTDPNVLLDRPR